MESSDVLMETDIPSLSEPHRGKARDNYDLGDGRMAIVTTDRLSAFDVIMNQGIPDKGKVLNQLTKFWLTRPNQVVPNHLLGTDLALLPPAFQRPELEGRTMIVRKVKKVFPVECVVRGYIMGSGWESYQADGTVCGIKLPPGLKLCDKLEKAIFTPTTKEEKGHDKPITFEQMVGIVGKDAAEAMRYASIRLYEETHDFALERGIIIADTKFEFGLLFDVIMLIDEVLTPDSSRFWPKESWVPGKNPPSLDKQPVRDWLKATGRNKQPPPPDLPPELVASTQKKYLRIYELLTGQSLAE